MPTPGEQLAKDIQQRFETHGVSDYIFMFRDPDSNVDWFETKGSKFWRMGASLDLLEQTKLQRRWEEEDSEEVT